MCEFDPTKNRLELFEGDDCVKNMIIEMHRISEECLDEMRVNQDLKMSKEDNAKYSNATICGICEEPFKSTDIRCRDHDHRTGEFRNATHQKCNVTYFSNRYVPAVFHNLKRYDEHL